jgi:hypothetical protein
METPAQTEVLPVPPLPDKTAIILPTVSPPHFPFVSIIKTYRTKIKRKKPKMEVFFMTFTKEMAGADKFQAQQPGIPGVSGRISGNSPAGGGGFPSGDLRGRFALCFFFFLEMRK